MMATKKQSAAERVETLEQVLIDVWHEAQSCDGTRGEQQSALDNIQTAIEDEMPDVSEYEPSTLSDGENGEEGDTDD